MKQEPIKDNPSPLGDSQKKENEEIGNKKSRSKQKENPPGIKDNETIHSEKTLRTKDSRDKITKKENTKIHVADSNSVLFIICAI